MSETETGESQVATSEWSGFTSVIDRWFWLVALTPESSCGVVGQERSIFTFRLSIG
jgi:hypothetical protein